MTLHRSEFLVALTALALLPAGCRSTRSRPNVGNTAFLAFEGRQQHWPVESSALVERDWPVPVYRGLPARPYAILGRVIGTQQNPIGRGLAEGLWSDRDRLQDVCRQAQIYGADAVMLTEDPRIMEALRVPFGQAGEGERPLYDFPGAVVAIQFDRGPH